MSRQDTVRNNQVFEKALDDASEDVLGYFDGLGIPPAGEVQHDHLKAAIRRELDRLLREWCV